MPASIATIYLAGNNEPLTQEIDKCLEKSNLRTEKNKTKDTDYRLLVYDTDASVENLGKIILNDLDSLSGYTGKVCLVLASCSEEGDGASEKHRSLVQPYLNDRKNNLRLIITRDLYQTKEGEAVDSFENWLCQIGSEGEVEVTPDGSVKFHPTSTDDLCELIVKSLFITNTSGKVFVGVTEEITDLEIAYLLKRSLEKKNSQLEINLSSREKRESNGLMDESIQTQALMNWIPKNSFSENISKILSQCSFPIDKETIPVPKTTLNRLEPLKPQKKENQKKMFGKIFVLHEVPSLHVKEKRALAKTIFIAALAVAGLAILPFVISFIGLYFSTTDTYRAYQEIRNGNEKKARSTLSQAAFYNRLATAGFRSVIPLGNIFAKEAINSTNNYLLILGHGQSFLNSVLETYSLGDQIYRGLLGKQSVDAKATTAALRVNLISISERLSQIQLLLDQVRLPFGYEERLSGSDINQSISLLKSQAVLALPILDLVEKVASNQALQRYLIIVQDTNELRPTGGFISTYGVLTLDQGRVIDFKVDSSLSLDRLIEGKIEPPSIVKQLLGQTNWSFHDSNLDADFGKSAEQMAWFYQRFKSVTVDGVFGLNLNLLRFILGEIGSTKLADGQDVSADNIFVLASNPTASKGLDVVTALTQTLGQKLLAGEINLAALSRALLKTVAANEINLWFSSPSLEALAIAGNLGGVINGANCHPQLASLACQADTIYFNESNMSVNKLNYYLKRAQNLVAEIGENGQVSYTLNYDYSYPVPVPTNFGLFYKTYYQLYLPPSSQKVSLTLDGQVLDPASLIQTAISGLTKIEFSASLSTNQAHHLEVKFISPYHLDLTKQFIPYTLAVLKQPGTLNNPLTIKIHYPKSLVTRNMTVPLKQTSAQELVFQTNQTSQENLGIIFKNQAL